MPEPIEPKEKKKSKIKQFFSKHKNRIGKFMTIISNVAFVLGISLTLILHLINPAFAIISVPSLITLFFQIVVKYAPHNLEESKNLFLKQLNSEEDKESVNKAYSDVLNTLNMNNVSQNPDIQRVQSFVNGLPSRNNFPSVPTPSPAESESNKTVRHEAHVVYNEKTGAFEFEVYEN